jgi:hypothetical protein
MPGIYHGKIDLVNTKERVGKGVGEAGQRQA